MSRIEQLKAEAVALRAAEKARGNDIKHCDALERIAKQHGYASWRACLASLRDEPSTPESPVGEAKPTSGADGMIASRLLAGEHEVARQRALSRWMSPDLRQAAVDFSRNLGLLPIYAETSRDGTRYLFWQLPAGAKCEVRSARTRAQTLEFDRVGREQGRRLVSLHISDDHLYSAVWISAEHHPAAVEHMKRFGITPAEIRPA